MTLTECLQMAREQMLEQHDEAAYRNLMAIVKREPGCADAYYLLSILAHKFKNFGKEMEMVGEAFRLEPNQLRYRIYYSRAKALSGDTGEAADLLEKVMLSDCDSMDLVDAMATTYNRLGLYREACHAYQHLVTMGNVNPSSWFNLGICYKYTGQFKESKAALKKAIAMKPDFYKAHAALASLGSTGIDKDGPFSCAPCPRIKQLRDLLNNITDSENHLFVAHALAKELEKQGEYVEAMSVLSRAKQARKTEISYDVAIDEEKFHQLEQNNQRIEYATNQKLESLSDIFIVGMPRSGTTLLDRIISGLESVTAGGELYQFSVAFKKICKLNHQQFTCTDALQPISRQALQQVGELYQKNVKYLKKSKILTNKLPINFFYAQHILEALPNSLMICLDRHPLDLIVGNYRQLFSFEDEAYLYSLSLEDCARFYVKFKHFIEQMSDIYSNRFHVIQYENLVLDPEVEIQKLLNWCGLPWTKNCLDIERNHQPVATASSVQVREGIHSRSIGQWQHYASALDEVQNIIKAAKF